MTSGIQKDDHSSWPDWLVDLDPELSETLNTIASVHARLKAKVSNGYDYQHVFQDSINSVMDQMLADGVISREVVDSPIGPASKNLKPIVRDPGFVAALASNNSKSYGLFGTTSFACILAVTKLLNGLHRGIQAGDLLVPFVCLRGAIEHVAHYHAVIQKLKPYTVPTTFEEANKSLEEISSLLMKSSYATRINWKVLFTASQDEQFELQEIKYERGENRADLEAKSILTAIDSLNKSVKGTRAVYEVLCEFAHPNVGNLMVFTESAESCTDSRGVAWVKKRLSPDVPRYFLNGCGVAVRRLFWQVARCLEHFETLLETSVEEREKVLKITQKVVQRLIATNRDVFDPYSPCPCGSERKVKFCCGK